MAQGQLSPVVQFLRKVSACARNERTDEQLLACFLRDRDEAAFAELLARHAGMVFAVCQRVLRDVHDAEDALQATFLILARRGAAICKRQALASWLHGVAYRVAMKARVQAARRHARQRPLQDMPMVEATPDFLWKELRLVLDEEIERLPERYRRPFVLCYLEGKTNEEAARLIACPRGTVFSRLAWARKRLCRRLTRRGIVLSLVALDLGLARHAASAMAPARLVQSTLQAALAAASGKAFVVGLASEQAAALAKGVLRSMFLTRLKTIGAMVVAVMLVGLGAGLLGSRLAIAEGGARAVAGVSPKAAPAKDDLDEKVREAIRRGVEYLKNSQRDGNWEHDRQAVVIKGGATALALLGLLEAGVEFDDPAVLKGLDYLRGVEPKQTYVVSLQTLVFARTNLLKDKERVQRNVDWLLAARCRDARGVLLGWTYTKSNSRITDSSNAQFAVLGLDAGHRAGAKLDKKDWQEIQDYYLRMQQADGGWVYNPSVRADSTFTMTSAGVCGLLICRKQLNEENETIDKAVARGLEFLGNHFVVESPQFQYYRLYGLARTGRLAEKKKLAGAVGDKSLDWYRLGAEWLVKHQAEDGSWNSRTDINSDIATSLALLFLKN